MAQVQHAVEPPDLKQQQRAMDASKSQITAAAGGAEVAVTRCNRAVRTAAAMILLDASPSAYQPPAPFPHPPALPPSLLLSSLTLPRPHPLFPAPSPPLTCCVLSHHPLCAVRACAEAVRRLTSTSRWSRNSDRCASNRHRPDSSPEPTHTHNSTAQHSTYQTTAATQLS